ncbi:MAG: FAD-dependent thymidylate synthase [Cellulosilyticaceae bacterium]
MKIVQASYTIRKLAPWKDMLQLVEEIARTCYKSEENITDISYEKFLRGIIDRGHEAMIEHVGFSVKFINDRGVSHEEVRHRLASFAQESTRYCDYSKDKFDKNVTYVDISRGIELDTKMRNYTAEQTALILTEWMEACQDAERHYFKMLDLGATPQIARGVLNNSTKTEIWITMNLREWRHFFSLRADRPAHPQMREQALPLLHDLQEECPLIFGDLHFAE